MTIEAVVSNIEDIILDITPSYLPGLAFSVAPGSDPIEDLPDAAGDTDRSVSVMPRQPSGVGSYQGTCWSIVSPIDVRVRYLRDSDGDSWRRLLIMAASDGHDIVAALTKPPAGTQWDDSLQGGLRLARVTDLQASRTQSGIYYITITMAADIVAQED